MAELAEKNAKLRKDLLRLDEMGLEVTDLKEKVDVAGKELAKEKQKHNLIKEQAQKMQDRATACEKQAVEQAEEFKRRAEEAEEKLTLKEDESKVKEAEDKLLRQVEESAVAVLALEASVRAGGEERAALEESLRGLEEEIGSLRAQAERGGAGVDDAKLRAELSEARQEVQRQKEELVDSRDKLDKSKEASVAVKLGQKLTVDLKELKEQGSLKAAEAETLRLQNAPGAHANGTAPASKLSSSNNLSSSNSHVSSSATIAASPARPGGASGGATVPGTPRTPGGSMREEDLNRRNAQIARSLHDMESMYKLQVDVLKQEIADMQSANHRDSVPQEYLKEIIVRFILLSPSLGAGPSEHEDLIPVLSDLLAFTPA
ncbi:hypothetical protein T484DRAFT_1967970, partial [Baffinella frigidus]